MKRFAVLLAPPLACIAVAVLPACKDDMKCERERMELNKSWSEVREAATRRKLDGVDTAAWTDIENKTELLESSFVTPEVTWDSATKAGQAVAAELPQLHADHDALAVGFRTSAESALKEQTDFEKQCR
jgi:hypothetical protein